MQGTLLVYGDAWIPSAVADWRLHNKGTISRAGLCSLVGKGQRSGLPLVLGYT